TQAGDRVIGAKHADVPADFHADEWEMHPGGDEVLYLLAGALDVVLDEPAGERTFGLERGQACLVPRGVWHRLVLRRPSGLLFITPPRGTRHPPGGTARPPNLGGSERPPPLSPVPRGGRGRGAPPPRGPRARLC